MNPYDIHFYFENTETSITNSLEIRQELKDEFPYLNFYQPHLKKIGPHPQPMWEADFSKFDLKHDKNEVEKQIKLIETWFKENEKCNDHSILIHPNTKDGLKDHTDNAIWVGQKLDLNLDVF